MTKEQEMCPYCHTTTFYTGEAGEMEAKVLHAGDTFEDKHGSLFVVMDSAIDDFNYWYIVNLSQKIVVKMRSEEAEKFVADMDSVDIGYCKVNRK